MNAGKIYLLVSWLYAWSAFRDISHYGVRCAMLDHHSLNTSLNFNMTFKTELLILIHDLLAFSPGKRLDLKLDWSPHCTFRKTVFSTLMVNTPCVWIICTPNNSY